MACEEDKWDWGHCSRKSVDDYLRTSKDGTFLVFYEGDPCRLNLAYRINGQNKFVDIYHQDDLYGFTEPLNFESLEDALDAYNWSPTETGNTLKFPGIKIKQPRRISMKRDGASLKDIEPRKLLIRLRYTVSQRSEKARELDAIVEENNAIQDRLRQKNVAIESLTRLIKMLETQLERHHQVLARLSDPSQADTKAVSENFDKLTERKSGLTGERQGLLEEKTEIELKKVDTVKKLSESDEELRIIEKDIDDIKRILLERNEGIADFLDALLNDIPSDSPKVYPRDVDLARSEQMLRQSPDGTFLVRNGRDRTKPFIVSVSFEGKVLHLPVLQVDDCFGFDKDTCIFDSIDEVVRHYSRVSFSVHDAEKYQGLILIQQCN